MQEIVRTDRNLLVILLLQTDLPLDLLSLLALLDIVVVNTIALGRALQMIGNHLVHIHLIMVTTLLQVCLSQQKLISVVPSFYRPCLALTSLYRHRKGA